MVSSQTSDCNNYNLLFFLHYITLPRYVFCCTPSMSHTLLLSPRTEARCRRQYYGRHGAKWCIHGKPIEFGYKMWVLATRLPYAVQSFCTKVKSFRHWMALILVVWLFIFIISFQIGLARSLSDTIIHILVLVFSRGGTQVFQQRWGQCHRVHTSQACMCLQ